jgi:hypothetical protein
LFYFVILFIVTALQDQINEIAKLVKTVIKGKGKKTEDEQKTKKSQYVKKFRYGEAGSSKAAAAISSSSSDSSDSSDTSDQRKSQKGAPKNKNKKANKQIIG